jgi:hypothetical protein
LGGKETGFLSWGIKITVGWEKETRFLGLVAGAKETGFLSWFPKITVGWEKETRFLGLVAGAKETGFLWLVSKDNCNIPKRNPVSGWGERNPVSGFGRWG